MHVNSIHKCSDAFHMSNGEGGSSLQWFAASVMTGGLVFCSHTPKITKGGEIMSIG
jgi:hypothetical protein